MNIKKSWSIYDQAKLYHRLSRLLERGYSLSTAIEFLILSETVQKKLDLQAVLDQLKGGIPLFLALSSIGFSNDGLSYIYFAEKYGELSKGLLNAGNMLEKKSYYKKRIGKLIRYPFFLVLFVIVLFVIMQNVLFPQFIVLYESMNITPSPVILFILHVNSLLPTFLSICTVLVVTMIIYYYVILEKKSSASKQEILCNLPLLKFFIKKYNTYFFSFHFGNLLGNGFSINEAIAVFKEQNQLLFYKEEAIRIRSLLVEGEQLEKILKETPYYDNELATVIVHGQANGILADELLDYSQLILDEAEKVFKFWLQVLQPTIIIVIGIAVVSMYLAIMLPLFRMIQTF